MRFLARAQAFRAPHAPTGRAAAAAIALTFAAIAPARAQSPDAATGLTLVGRWEGEAETTRWPLFLDLRLRRDAASLAATLRVLGQTVSFDVARAVGDSLLLRSGEGPRALVIAAAIHDGALRGKLIQGTDTLPLVLHPVPVYPRPRDRAEGWGQDLDALATRFLTFDRSFSPAERASFLEAIEETRRRVSELNDHEIVMRMAAAVALARNAHTRLYLLRNRTELRRLPVRLWWFADGRRADTHHEIVLSDVAYRVIGDGCLVDEGPIPIGLNAPEPHAAYGMSALAASHAALHLHVRGEERTEVHHGANVEPDSTRADPPSRFGVRDPDLFPVRFEPRSPRRRRPPGHRSCVRDFLPSHSSLLVAAQSTATTTRSGSPERLRTGAVIGVPPAAER